MWSVRSAHCSNLPFPLTCMFSSFSSFPVNINLGNFSFTQHHLFCCRSSLIFILRFPCWMDHLTRNLDIHWHGSCLTILPLIFWFCAPLFRAPPFHHSLTQAIFIDSPFKETPCSSSSFALLICCSFPLSSLPTVFFLFSNFSTLSIEKIIASSSFPAFISKVA